MKALKRSLLILVPAFLLGGTGQAQTVLDGPYIKEHTKTKKVVPYAHLREADVFWSKRVWRIIDMREKVNHPLYYPVEEINDRKNLFDVIRQALLVDGSITAYDPGALLDDDEFTKPMLTTQLKDVFTRIDTSWTEDLETGEFIPVVQEITLESADIKQYRIKEDWFFDKQRSKMDVRIIGIAPMKEVRGEDGEFRGFAPIFWLFLFLRVLLTFSFYFPQTFYVIS